MGKTVLRIVLTLFLVGWLLTQVELTSVGAIVSGANPWWLIAGILANLFALFLGTLRWQLLLYGMGVRQPFLNLLRILLIGTFFSMFLPSSIGGDLVKMALIAPDTEQREAAVSSVLMDRIIGMGVTIAVGLVALLFLPEVWINTTLIMALVVIMGLFVGAVGLLFNTALLKVIEHMLPRRMWQRLGASLVKAHMSLMALRRRPAILFGSALVSALRQLSICLAVYFAGRAFGIIASPVVYFAMIPFSQAITVLPIAINGLGLQDNAFVLLLGFAGVSPSEALALSLFMHILSNGTGLIGGLVFAVGRRRQSIPDTVFKQGL
ncbi:lysylphosphatidylglycerol synthase transmembrane domain-containing protein [Candidatus Chloroploca sp. Khr17]|uniref:lysylphosphatidylglycerol synthase transmembrane domain-containing protein n=1 Tax=Candidatus Chloroploca sp. Khr17 TaxID=2496869 RepID=UPI00101D522C|nr:lysylphosphatidylglycerol synthase transmembrane domain-containing protein [Candidatus Chloroploca sp. Khr17]